MKPNVLRDKGIKQLGRTTCDGSMTGITNVAIKAQYDICVAFYEQKIREIFEEIEAYCKSGQCWVKTDTPFNWQALKSKYQGGTPEKEPA
jgi:hypothetical protein